MMQLLIQRRLFSLNVNSFLYLELCSVDCFNILDHAPTGFQFKIYIYTSLLPSTLHLRMTEQQSKCRLLVPVILSAKNCFKENKIKPHVARVSMGDI